MKMWLLMKQSFWVDFRIKKTDDLKTLAKLALAPHLILDIFILDKYRLVLTPPPPP